VASGNRVDLDLSRDLSVTVTDERLARTVEDVGIEFTVLGAAITDTDAPLRDGTATLDPGLARRAVGGAAGATLVLSGDGTEGRADQRHDFAVEATQSWYLTAPGLLGILLLLIALANLESTLKPLGTGRMRKLSFVGATLSGALIGTGLVALSAALGLAEPTVPGLVTATVLAAAAGAGTARARLGDARRRRVRRAVKRAERSLGVRVTGT
jgi:hypothetical protein